MTPDHFAGPIRRFDEPDINEVCAQCHWRRGQHRPPADGQPESCPGRRRHTWGTGTFDPSGRYMTREEEERIRRGGGQVEMGLGLREAG